jgi:hypothetical protein
MHRDRRFMVPRFPVAGLLLLLAVCGIGVGWRAAHSAGGYPVVVFYSRATMLTMTNSGEVQATYEEWVDPTQHRDRSREQDVTGTTTILSRDGSVYQTTVEVGGSRMSTTGLLQPDGGEQAARDRQLLAGGWPRVFVGSLGQGHGPVAHVAFAGRPALTYTLPGGVTMWTDLRTRLPLQRQWDFTEEHTTYRYLIWSRLSPNTLPATFFDPPAKRQALWDQFTGWLHARLPFQRP